MYAIIETGGKQYKVSEGDVVFIEKLDVEEGASITFDKVLMAGEGDAVKVGTPVVEGATVTANVLKNGSTKHLPETKPSTKNRVDNVGLAPGELYGL